VPYLIASEVMIYEEALYQVYVLLPLPFDSETRRENKEQPKVDRI